MRERDEAGKTKKWRGGKKKEPRGRGNLHGKNGQEKMGKVEGGREPDRVGGDGERSRNGKEGVISRGYQGLSFGHGVW